VVRSNVYGDAVAIDGRAVGATGPTAHSLAPEVGWQEAVAFLREKLQERWSGGEPPAAFGVTDEGVMGFQVRNPTDADVWHRYTVDVRNLAVAPVENAPSVVSLQCVDGSECIRQGICRGDHCTAGDFTTQHRWFFDDAKQGAKVARACDHLIELARRRPPPKRAVREPF